MMSSWDVVKSSVSPGKVLVTIGGNIFGYATAKEVDGAIVVVGPVVSHPCDDSGNRIIGVNGQPVEKVIDKNPTFVL